MRPEGLKPSAIAGGGVCGIPGISGKVIPEKTGNISGCGIRNPVSVTAVQGIELTKPARMDCTTAKVLDTWVRNAVIPASKNTVTEMHVVADYACRTRNNQPGAKVSEHGKGRAIDIAGFTMSNWDKVTLLKHWGSKTYGDFLRALHQKACGPFGTVLGPNANKYHLDHFHFDTARYRAGTYCR